MWFWISQITESKWNVLIQLRLTCLMNWRNIIFSWQKNCIRWYNPSQTFFIIWFQITFYIFFICIFLNCFNPYFFHYINSLFFKNLINFLYFNLYIFMFFRTVIRCSRLLFNNIFLGIGIYYLNQTFMLVFVP